MVTVDTSSIEMKEINTGSRKNKIQWNIDRIIYYVFMSAPVCLISILLTAYYSVGKENELLCNISLIITVITGLPIALGGLYVFNSIIIDIVKTLKIITVEVTQSIVGYIIIAIYITISALILMTKEPFIIATHIFVSLWLLNVKRDSNSDKI